MTSGRAEIAGSVVRRSPSASHVKPADPNQVIEATIVIRRPPGLQQADPSTAFTSGKTREEIEKSLSADATDVAVLTDFAHRYGLTVKETSPEKRSLVVEGAVNKFDQAFGIELGLYSEPDGSYVSYEGPISVESDVAGRIVAILGLNQAPVARHRIGFVS